jgi:predicted RNA-binding protein with PIN domain
MPYIIDGHNLIPKIPGLSLSDIDDEMQLIKLLQEFCRQQRRRADVYFDNTPPGQPRTRKFGSVTAHFIRQGITADTAIRNRLRKLGRSARNWTVVTSDREVTSASKESHARVITSEVFANNLISNGVVDSFSPETDENLALDEKAVEDWLKIFGEEEDFSEE